MTRTTDRRGGGGDDKTGKGGEGTGATVIHVAFGRGGGRIDPNAVRKDDADAGALQVALDTVQNGREPVTDVFTRREVARLLAVSEARLRSLDRASIVSPSGLNAPLKRCEKLGASRHCLQTPSLRLIS